MVVRRLGKFSVLPSQFFCKPKMPQKHNLVINFFKSLELIFKSWMVEGRMVARRPVWRLMGTPTPRLIGQKTVYVPGQEVILN